MDQNGPIDRWGRRIDAAQTLLNLGENLWNRYVGLRDERLFTVSVSSDNVLYPEVLHRLLDLLPETQQRALLAQAQKTDRTHELQLYYDGMRDQRIRLRGHEVKVYVDDGQRGDSGGDTLNVNRHRRRWLGNTGGANTSSIPKLRMVASSIVGRTAVLDFLREVTAEYEREQHGRRTYVSGKWGDWVKIKTLAPRPLDTVILTDGLLEDLVADMERFLSSEQLYARLGLPWHRGYLLHGPPGTGKTSVPHALATHLGLDIYVLNLPDIEKDSDLASMVSEVEPRSIMLVEDVDAVQASRSREDSGPMRISTTGLLNAFDGLTTPTGLITVMTTNHVQRLDPALTREGRADRTVEIGPLDDGQLRRLLELVSGEAVTCDLPSVAGRNLVPAQVIEWAKPHLEDLEMLKIVLERLENGL